MGSSRGNSQPVFLFAWTRCEETKRPREAAPVLTAAGSGVLDGFGSFRGGGRKRGVQPAPLEETSPQLEPKTRRAAGEPELTLGCAKRHSASPPKSGYGPANRIPNLFVGPGIHSTARKGPRAGVRSCRARCVGQGRLHTDLQALN